MAPSTEVGVVEGVVWFDRNEDGLVSAREWPLPGVPVVLTAVSTGAGLRVAAVAAPLRTVTAPDGSYRFTGVAPGAYRVTASAVHDGFAYSSDSDGLADWRVDVQVSPQAAAAADFAGLGKGAVGGDVFLTTADRTPVTAAVVTCRWAGFDDVMGTADDVDMDVVAGSDGRFAIDQVPYGEFRCAGVDPLTGRTSAAAQVSVASAEPVEAPLPIVPPAATGVSSPVVRPAPAAPAPVVRATTLPRTGSPLRALLAAGLGLLLLGLVGQRLGRRRAA